MLSETGTGSRTNSDFFTASIPGFYSLHVHGSVASGGLQVQINHNGQIQNGAGQRQTALTFNSSNSPSADTFTFLLATGDTLGRSIPLGGLSWQVDITIERNGDEL